MKAGSAIIFDYRILHRGLANLSQSSRPLLYYTYARAWFRDMQNFPARSLFDGGATCGASKTTAAGSAEEIQSKYVAENKKRPDARAAHLSPHTPSLTHTHSPRLLQSMHSTSNCSQITLATQARGGGWVTLRGGGRSRSGGGGSYTKMSPLPTLCPPFAALHTPASHTLEQLRKKPNAAAAAAWGEGGTVLGEEDVLAIRKEFPTITRLANEGVVLCDAAGGSQVHCSVIAAMQQQLLNRNCNVGGPFKGSLDNLEALTRAREAIATFLNCAPCEVVLGNNATTLAFHVARALAKDKVLNIRQGDNIVVSSMDHACNVALMLLEAAGPWETIAREKGAELRRIKFDRATWTLEPESVRRSIDARTKIVAIGAASNLLGSVNDLSLPIACARAVGAVSFVDGVHFAPHAAIDVKTIGCDMLVCSPYKYFGPHAGTLFVREELALRLTPDKLRPSSDELPSYGNFQGNRWELGTQNYEGIAGTAAAILYLESLAPRLEAARAKKSTIAASASLWSPWDSLQHAFYNTPTEAGSTSAGGLAGVEGGGARQYCTRSYGAVVSDTQGEALPVHGRGLVQQRRVIRGNLENSFELIQAHEACLTRRFLEGLNSLPHVVLYGKDRLEFSASSSSASPSARKTPSRTPTFAVTFRTKDESGYVVPQLAAEWLQRERAVWCASGNFYAVDLTEALNVEQSGGLVRFGFLHYNTIAEVDKVVHALDDLRHAGLPTLTPAASHVR